MAGHAAGVLDVDRLFGEVVPALRAGVGHPLVDREIARLQGLQLIGTGRTRDPDFAGLGAVVAGHFDESLSATTWQASDVVVAGTIRPRAEAPVQPGAWDLRDLGLLVEAMTMQCVDTIAHFDDEPAVGRYLVGVYDRQDRAEDDGAESDPDLAALASLLEQLQGRWAYWHGHGAAGLRGFSTPPTPRLSRRFSPPWIRGSPSGRTAQPPPGSARSAPWRPRDTAD